MQKITLISAWLMEEVQRRREFCYRQTDEGSSMLEITF